MTQSAVAQRRPQLSVLGGFELTVGDEPLSLCASGEKLLAFLAVHGRFRPVRRTALAERLWSDTDPARASASLRSVLWRLPRPQGVQLVRTSSASLHLADDVTVDLWHAEDTAQAIAASAVMGETVTGQTVTGQTVTGQTVTGQTVTGETDSAAALADRAAALADRAAALADRAGCDPVTSLGGDLLPGWSDDWLILEQEAFRQTRLHALEQTCARLRHCGHYAAALRAGSAAVRCEPLRESAHRQLIKVHLAEGNHAEALRQYQSFRRLLAYELGLPPSASIRSLVAPLLGRPIDHQGRETSQQPAPEATHERR
ncbi:AfsR/SARP family transcriptional regulator [Jatrophihabitans lederbergiae]|uniref:Bacterial transcriptional activator domain-containing protein n=1 Tax=Jatrophihabitans lederbergiae TaxID=3075547 RepID=A0ABU2JE11_9ACTN|nr:bacterial transcriptional activator domain-containing protein [Jatrophihabitans sp. DSM 44399]MDT0262714.1 bacterial transcriptional activator domain-containing protein [Jatrophihabitans sp. DSM 44399]